MNKVAFPFFVILLSFPSIIEAQDPYFAQFYANRVYLNPAYAGFDPGTTVLINYRNQWPGIADGGLATSATSYRTFNATGDFRMPCFSGIQNFSLGLAGSFFHDGAGRAPLVTQGAGTALSAAWRIFRPGYSKKIKYIDLRAGVQVSAMKRRIDGDFFVYSDQLNAYFGLITDPSTLSLSSKIYSNWNVGGMINLGGERFKLSSGISLSNVSEPDYALYDASEGDILPRRYTGHLGFTTELTDNVFLSPQVRADLQSDFDLGLFSGGAYLQTDKMYGGVFYQWNKNTLSQIALDGLQASNVSHLIFNFGIDVQSIVDLGNKDRIQNRFVLGVTYDFSLSGLNQNDTQGGLEFAIRMFFDGGKKANCLEDRKNSHRRCPIITH
jgi:type IX secretion system PorP/SprF family membrane protein